MEEKIKKQYLLLLTEIIAKEAVVFGSDIVILKARSAGLIIDNAGNVTDIKGNASEALKKLIDEYIDLSGQIAKDIILPIFEKYPLINI